MTLISGFLWQPKILTLIKFNLGHESLKHDRLDGYLALTISQRKKKKKPVKKILFKFKNLYTVIFVFEIEGLYWYMYIFDISQQYSFI